MEAGSLANTLSLVGSIKTLGKVGPGQEGSKKTQNCIDKNQF